MGKTNWTEVDRSGIERTSPRFAGDRAETTDEDAIREAYESGRRGALWQKAYERGRKAGEKTAGKLSERMAREAACAPCSASGDAD